MLPTIFAACQLRQEIEQGKLAEEVFAAKLSQVVEGKAPRIYQGCDTFFANTFPTNGLKTLISEVFGRLSGKVIGSPIIRLETSFGGGKTHDEIALWHIARQGRAIEYLRNFVDDIELIPGQAVQVAAIACQDLDPVNGVLHEETGIKTFTLWGEIAYQLGGIDGFSFLKGSDEQKIAPGTKSIERIIQGQPTLIILDEIGDYLRKARATLVGSSDLSKQVISFLFALMDLAASSSHIVFVYTLAESSDAYQGETDEIREAIRISARQERVLRPSTDVEIYNIVKRRIFSSIDERVAENAATEYLQAYKSSRLTLPEGCKDTSYAEVIQASYPFHPELFNLLTKKIAAIPNFQRTRGALRLFAMVARHLWMDSTQWIPMIHAHHIPLGLDQDVTNDLTSRLDRQLLNVPIQADIFNRDGREAHAQHQDHEWLAAGKPPLSTWVARTIFLHSINQGIASGIRRAELNLSLLTPGQDNGFIDTALERLTAVAWYLDIDPITTIARFKEEPSINKIIEEEKQQVGVIEAKEELRMRRDSIFADKYFKLIAAPASPGDVDDTPERVVLCVIDFDEETVSQSIDPPPPLVEAIFNQTGDQGKFRTFRNRLVFLLANSQELGRAIDKTREYIAIRRIQKSQTRLSDLSENQQKQLNTRAGDTDLGVRVALTNTYRHLFYGANDPVKAPKGLFHYTLPAQEASEVKGNKNQQDTILKALRDCQKIRSENATALAPAYVLQKVWPVGVQHWTTKALSETFAKDISLNIFLEPDLFQLRETLKKGLEEGQWDLKVGNTVYIRDASGRLSAMPPTLEFTDRMELYRRGILEPPAPRVVELSAQIISSNNPEKTVRVRWRAQSAISIQLYQNSQPVLGEFAPSDEYEGQITETTLFRVVANYGEGESAEAEQRVTLYGTESPGIPTVTGEEGTIFATKSSTFDEVGSLNGMFNRFKDWCRDNHVAKINQLSLTVDTVVDYRKFLTVLPRLQRYPFTLDQSVSVTKNNNFLRLVYQGDWRGFQVFKSGVESMLGESIEPSVHLRVEFPFNPSLAPQDIDELQKMFQSNPLDKTNLQAQVSY